MSDTRNQILLQLADGSCCSGNELARQCGVSRAAVWKHIESLRDQGVDIRSVAQKGYQIPNGIALLDQALIHEGLAADMQLHILSEVPSTNDYLMQRLAEANGQTMACLAERQTAGRGTRGRSWQSPYASNMYGSIYWRFSRAPFELGGLSLAVAVTLAESLQEAGLDDIQIKWPNDLYTSKGKLGGILIDMSAEANGPSDVVIGVGINKGMPADLRAGIDQAAADIDDNPDITIDRSQLAILMLKAIAQACTEFDSEGFASFHERWPQFDWASGEHVELVQGEHRYAGIARGVTEQGMLKLDNGSEILSYASGDVSLRKQR